MRVSTRLMLALCVVTGAFMGALLTLRYWQNQNVQTVLLDRSDAISRFSDKAVDLLEKNLQAHCQDYSVWTELVDFVGTGDPKWAAENLMASFKTFDTDAVWVARPDASQVYFGTDLADKEFGGLLPLKGRAEALFAQSRLAHFFIRIPSGLMEVYGATIHPSEDIDRKTPPAGYFFTGRLWNSGHLDKLSSLIDGTATLVLDGSIATARPGTLLEGSALVFHHPLPAWDGTPLAVLEIRSVAPLIDRFVENAAWGLALAGSFCLGLLALFTWLLMRWVNTPLRMLAAALAANDPAGLGGLGKNRSEFGNIARLVTAHFEQSKALLREMDERKQAERALGANEANLKSLFNAIPESVFLMDRDGNVLAANATFAERLGRSVEDCLGVPVYTLIPGDLAEQRLKLVSELLRTREPVTFEDCRQGRWIRHSIFPVFDEDRAIIRIVVYAIDITKQKQSDAELRESQERFSNAFTYAASGMALVSLEGRWLKVNSAVCEMLGYNEEELLARTFQELTVPEDLDSDMACVGRMLAGELSSYHLEKRYYHRQGQVVWAMLGVSLVRGPQGEPAYFISQIQDITDRKKAEEALRESEFFLREIQKIARLGGWKANPSTDALEWNDGVYDIIEERRDYAPGLAEGMKYYLPEYLPLIKKSLADCLATETPFVVECKIVTATGKPLWTEIRGLARVTEGEHSSVVGTLQDITDRKRAELDLLASETRYRRLFESAKDGILILDTGTGQILDVNPFLVELLGFAPEYFLGKKLWELGLFGDIAASEEAFRKLQEEGHIRYENLPLAARDGRRLKVEFVSNVYGVGDATVIQCNIRDISERKRLEEQLRQAQKMDAVGQLAGGIAHDFNNLLQVILGNVGLIQRMQAPGAPAWDEVEEVRRAAGRAAELTQQLLAFSRRQTIQPVDADLNELIQGVLKMLRRLIGERIELCFIPGNPLEMVRADRGQIEQALMNLSVNARDAMPRGGKLTIRTENALMDAAFCRDNPWAVEGRHVLVTVTDTGRGMDAAMSARVFEPFFSTKEVGQGTGLGLATVYGIVKQHDGLIHVESVPQKGTVFRVYLPVVDHPAREAREPAKQPVLGGNETILVAEDEPPVLNLIASLLTTVGYNVLTACDGNEAVRVFTERGGNVDLAVLDVVMPGLGGREAMEQMRAANPHTRFLFSSGYSASSIHKDFIIEEGLRLIRKPYRREDLLRAVREVLDAPPPETPSESSPANEPAP